MQTDDEDNFSNPTDTPVFAEIVAERLTRRGVLGLGMGLAAMAERVRILEGVMDINSEEGEGTTITVSLPV